MSRLTQKEYASYVTTFEGMTFKELAEAFKTQKAEISESDSHTKKLKEIHDILRLKSIPEKLESEDMSSINLKGVGRLGMSLDMNVSILAENREAWIEWLTENGHGALAKMTVNAQTQKAFVKEQVKEAAEVGEDPDLPEFVKYEPFYRGTVTKS